MIELFKQPNIDWMGKAKYFFALSGLLLVIGWSAILLKGGIKYGIDFSGGTNVDVLFAQPPDIDKLRSALQAQGLGGSEIQSISDIATPKSNEVLIFVQQTGQGDQALDKARPKSSRHSRPRMVSAIRASPTSIPPLPPRSPCFLRRKTLSLCP